MKNLQSVIALLSILVLFSFGKKEPDYTKILPGVVKITDRLYYDQTEVTNINWLEYLHWNASVNERGRKSKEYQSALPDTTDWPVCCDTMPPPLTRLYLRHPSYRSYPVVGITQTQAMKYCDWRTKRVEEVMIEKKKRHKAPEKFLYRLPTLTEWEMIDRKSVV